MSFHFGLPPLNGTPLNGKTARTDVRQIEAVVFDVDGTLVDSVLPTLCAWQDVLSDYGYCFTPAELHRWSGHAPGDMLAGLLPASVPVLVRKAIACRQREVYSAKYLHRVRAFGGAGELIEGG